MNDEINVLQIANGYLSQKLYANLFEHLVSEKVNSKVYIPINRKNKKEYTLDSDIVLDRCFSELDRIFFFTKQKKMINGILKTIDLSKINVIHAHTLFSGGYTAWKLYKEYGIPYIVAVRNTDVNVFLKYMIHLRKIGITIMKDALQVIFLSSPYREHVINKYVPENLRKDIRKKSVVIPNGIDDYFLQNKPTARIKPENGISLIYVGEISANKNLELTIHAASILYGQGINVNLITVGKIIEKKYQKLIEKTEFISYFPRCPKESVLEHLRHTDIFVMPSHTETFGLVYAEAMSQGLPVLYTKGQGFDGQFPEGTVGYAVSDTDAEDLADKIKRVIENYEQLSSNCVEMADKFDWHTIAKQYKEIYQVIVEGGKA